MTEIHPGQRVAVLVDAQNLYHTAQSLHSRNIDYSALLEKAVQDRQLTRAIATSSAPTRRRKRASSRP